MANEDSLTQKLVHDDAVESPSLCLTRAVTTIGELRNWAIVTVLTLYFAVETQ